MALNVTVHRPGHEGELFTFDRSEISIGRGDDNDLVLNERGVSGRHARLVIRGQGLSLEDLGSTNGTYVNGERIVGPQPVCATDEVALCEYRLVVAHASEVPGAEVPGAEVASADGHRLGRTAPPDMLGGPGPGMRAVLPKDGLNTGEPAESCAPPPILEGGRTEAPALLGERVHQVSAGGGADLSVPPPAPLRETPVAAAPPAPPAAPAPSTAPAPAPSAAPTPVAAPTPSAAPTPGSMPEVAGVSGGLDAVAPGPPAADLSSSSVPTAASVDLVYAGLRDAGARGASEVRMALVRAGHGHAVADLAPRLVAELTGNDALSLAVADAEVVGLWLQGPVRMTVQRAGVTRTCEPAFSCAAALDDAVQRLARREFGPRTPFADIHTRPGLHLRAVHGSWSRAGTVVRGTKWPVAAPSLADLVRDGVLSRGTAQLLSLCVTQGLRMLLCGGPDVSTAALLHALAAAAPDPSRQVVVSVGRGLPGIAEHALVLEAPRSEDFGGLIDAALQFDPSRILIHSVAGTEAATGLLAMARVRGGGVLSMRAATAAEGLTRLATMFRLAEGCDQEIAANYIAGAVDLVVSTGKLADGRQLVLEVAEPAPRGQGGGPVTPLLIYDPAGQSWQATGPSPGFFADLVRRGIEVDASMLRA